MKTYKVALTRIYKVAVEADSGENAQRIAEFFLGDCPDASTERDRKERNFSIKEIEMAYNEASNIGGFE